MEISTLSFEFFTISKPKVEWNWNTLVDSLLQICFCSVIFHTFRLIKVFLLFSIKLRVGICKTPNLEPGMPKSQIISSQSFEWYGKTRAASYELQVASYELRVTSWELKSTSWNSKVQVQIHELRVRIQELRVRIHESRVRVFENH